MDTGGLPNNKQRDRKNIIHRYLRRCVWKNYIEGGIVEMNNHWPAGDVAGGSKARMFLQRKSLYKFCKNSHGKPSTHGESPMDHGTFSSLPNTAAYRSVYNNPQTCTMYYHVNVLVMSNVHKCQCTMYEIKFLTSEFLQAASVGQTKLRICLGVPSSLSNRLRQLRLELWRHNPAQKSQNTSSTHFQVFQTSCYWRRTAVHYIQWSSMIILFHWHDILFYTIYSQSHAIISCPIHILRYFKEVMSLIAARFFNSAADTVSQWKSWKSVPELACNI